MCQPIKFSLFLLLILNLFSCKEKKENNNTEQVSSIPLNITEQEVHPTFNSETSLILLPREEYDTYRDHFAYISPEEYLGSDSPHVSHLDDTISTGLYNLEGKLGLVDSLRLDQDWFCIHFPFRDSSEQTSVYNTTTISYSYNDLIDYVPLTLLSLQNGADSECSIAFRGHCDISEFKELEGDKLSSEEQINIIKAIRKKVLAKDAIPPRPMTTDTLLLDNIYKISDNFIVAKFVTTRISDSDGDFGNEALFVLQDGKLNQWLAGMDCTCHLFEFRNEKYLYIVANTYATSKTTLLKLTDDVKVLYTYLFIGD